MHSNEGKPREWNAPENRILNNWLQPVEKCVEKIQAAEIPRSNARLNSTEARTQRFAPNDHNVFMKDSEEWVTLRRTSDCFIGTSTRADICKIQQQTTIRDASAWEISMPPSKSTQNSMDFLISVTYCRTNTGRPLQITKDFICKRSVILATSILNTHFLEISAYLRLGVCMPHYLPPRNSAQKFHRTWRQIASAITTSQLHPREIDTSEKERNKCNKCVNAQVKPSHCLQLGLLN